MNEYTIACANCEFWDKSDEENIGICKFVAEKNKWAYLVHDGGRCLITTPDFYCKGHEFKESII